MLKFVYNNKYFIKIYCTLVPGGLDGWYYPSKQHSALTYWADDPKDLLRLFKALKDRHHYPKRCKVVAAKDYPTTPLDHEDYGFYLEDIPKRVACVALHTN